MESERSNVQTELYFLIAKFLKNSPCQEAAKVLQNELEKHHIIEKRLDWEGNEHDQSFADVEKKYPHIGPRHLEEICCRLGPLLDKEIKPTVPGLKSLLGAGRQSLLRTKDSERRFFTLLNFATRKHGVSIYSPQSITNHNVVQALVGQSISGPASRRHLVTPKMFSRVRLLNRTLGHLSAVYCLLFDRTGRYIVTGADDLLVKVWSAVDGRLLNSFRGTSAEITDIDINLDNTLLAAGSLDKSIRVWCMQTGYPVATLSSHTGSITGVNFWPNSVDGCSYLVSTSSDGSIAFWSYAKVDGQSVFESKPIQYHEKLRPGQSQMLCARFSPGGMFLATGSADHHVRVYKMDREAPYRILEIEKHSDRVDSIQWANRGLKFVSGSKDGTAVIWHYQSQRWNMRQLLMSTPLNGVKNENEDSKVKLKVTMVCWNSDDSFLITSVNDNTIKIWDPSSGKLVNILKIHKDEVYVLENHPDIPRVMLSAGHDGAVHLWDIVTGEILSSYQNHIEGQGNGAVFDAKWSPDGTMIAATDAHGHILIFGIAPLSGRMKDVPRELFFHTDYRPIIRDGITDQVIDEQTQVPPHLMPPPFLVDIEGTPYPPTFQRLVPGRENCTNDQLIPNIVTTLGGQQEVVDGNVGEARSNIDDMIRALAGMPSNARHPNTVSPRSRPRGGEEGVRQSSGNWHRDGLDWKERVIIARLSPGTLQLSKRRVEAMAELELEEYDRESRRIPEIVPEISTAPVKGQKQHRRQNPAYRTRAVRGQQLRDQVTEAANAEEPEYERDSTTNQGDSSDVNSDDMSSESTDDSSSTEYSDWVADHGVNLEPPKRSRQRRTKKPSPSPLPRPPPAKKPAPVNINAPSCSTAPIPALPVEIPDSYKPSEWLAEVIPKKFPYYPQMGDEVVFFAQGYDLYLKAVILKQFYDLAKTQLKPWGNLQLNEPELVKIIGIKYELRPPRLCCLRLAVMRPNGKLTTDRFTIKYHDIPDVIDFFVLKQTYDIAMERQWKVGDRFRSMIDDGWWWGTIQSRTKSNSMFLGYKIKWDNGESEAMSPWDMEPIDYNREPDVEGGSVPVLPEEISAILYHPRGDEWPGGDRESACRRILAGLEEIMALSVAEPFNAPVDINVYPTYSYIVDFPIDLSTIKARFENRFYRTLTAAQFDIRYLATNAEKFNEPHSTIVKQARIVTDLCLKICKDYNLVDVSLLYRQLLDAYHSSASEPDEPKPSSSKQMSRKEKAVASRSLRAMGRAHQQNPDWRRDCRQLLDVLFNCQDSEPFREPVDRLEHPDYDKVIDTPMDLGTVREELLGGNYSNPLEFCKDVRMIFSNSRSYNTNKRSRIYVMTVRLAAMAEEHMKKIISYWKSSLRRQNREGQGKSRRKPVPRKKRKKKSDSDNETTSDEDGDSDYNTKKPARHKGKTKKKKPVHEAYDRNVHGESSGVRTRTLPTNKRVPVDSSESDSDDEEPPVVNVDSDTPSSSDEEEGPSRQPVSKAGISSKSNSNYSNKLGATAVGKRRVVASNHVSYKERNDSSSSSTDDGPTKNWTMNGHIKVLRPVRRATLNPVASSTKSSESESEEKQPPARPIRQAAQNHSFKLGHSSRVDQDSSDEEEAEEKKQPPARPVRLAAQNHSFKLAQSSRDEDSSDEEEEQLPVRPVRQAAQNHSFKLGHSSRVDQDSSDEEEAEEKKQPPARPVRLAAQNHSFKLAQSSRVEDSSDEEEEQLPVRPVRQAAQNHSFKLAQSSRVNEQNSDEGEEEPSLGRPVRQAAQNHSFKLAQSLRVDEESLDEEEEVIRTSAKRGVGQIRQSAGLVRRDVGSSRQGGVQVRSARVRQGENLKYTISVDKSSEEEEEDDDDGDDDDEEVEDNDEEENFEDAPINRPARQVNNVVFQRNGHASELDSEVDDSENDDVESEEEVQVNQKVIVLRNPSAPPIRGIKRRRTSDSDFSIGSQHAGRSLRAVKRRNYAASNESETENARPRRSATMQSYEDGSDSLDAPRSVGRPQRTLTKTYKESNSESDEPKRASRPVRSVTNLKYASSEESDENVPASLNRVNPQELETPLLRKVGRPRKAPKPDLSDDEPPTNRRPRTSVKYDESESSESDESPQPKLRVSRSGRVIKMNERVRAFLRD